MGAPQCAGTSGPLLPLCRRPRSEKALAAIGIHHSHSPILFTASEKSACDRSLRFALFHYAKAEPEGFDPTATLVDVVHADRRGRGAFFGLRSSRYRIWGRGRGSVHCGWAATRLPVPTAQYERVHSFRPPDGSQLIGRRCSQRLQLHRTRHAAIDIFQLGESQSERKPQPGHRHTQESK